MNQVYRPPPRSYILGFNHPEYPDDGPEFPVHPEYPDAGPESPTPPKTEQDFNKG
jgi:hypothetical protein